MKNTEKSFASDKVIGQTRGVSRLHSDRVPSNEVHQVKFNKQTDERGEGGSLNWNVSRVKTIGQKKRCEEILIPEKK